MNVDIFVGRWHDGRMIKAFSGEKLFLRYRGRIAEASVDGDFAFANPNANATWTAVSELPKCADDFEHCTPDTHASVAAAAAINAGIFK